MKSSSGDNEIGYAHFRKALVLDGLRALETLYFYQHDTDMKYFACDYKELAPGRDLLKKTQKTTSSFTFAYNAIFGEVGPQL